ncbi:MAG: hypothetical protein BWY38_02740 [Ignavibacteria bacterium ADurb.Bin266]|nr:MAG: hypothetical protein BWY38_02740 [Ignavibacteria bacterium ADurb.Bin266]
MVRLDVLKSICFDNKAKYYVVYLKAKLKNKALFYRIRQMNVKIFSDL